MNVIEEIKTGHTRYYKVSCYTAENKLISSRKIKYIIKSKTINQIRYFLIFDMNGRLVEQAYQYINFYKGYMAETSKREITFHIRQLHEFSEIINKDISYFKITDINKLIVFLKGYDSRSILADNLYLYSNKSEATVSDILGFLKDYVKFCGYSSYKYFKMANVRHSNKNNRNNLNVVCPKFISLYEMKKILNYIKNDDSLSYETKLKYILVYRLMFNRGMRIGEVLGLTYEDFEKFHTDTIIGYKVYIRNRYSDNLKQRAKRCLAMDGEYTYNSPEYHILDIGYQQVFINEEFYEDIMEYFDIMSARFKKEGKEMTRADSVYGQNTNWYIFYNLNRATPLNKDIFSVYTRKMFKDLGIHIDKSKRSNNLLHRFRHGFCMYLLFVEKIPPIEACKLTRHRNMESLSVYNNPTEEMIIKLLEKVEEGIQYGIK